MDDLDPTERRSQARILTLYRMPVLAAEGEVEGYLMDISREGLRVRFLADKSLTDVERLHIELPAWLGMGRPMEVSGRFVWFRPGDGFRGPEGGFSFDAMNAAERKRIDLLIEGILQAAEEDGLLSHAMSDAVPGVGTSLF